ncbi:hypothetical protein [Bacillus salipaludis]|uniref:hypothetical protein n=1 Tax=Bacillus salipaludis TaxID=2547811 RepID=UPI002E1BE583|nr:hypothetical protein [Bacillus salipaludis]
MKKRKKFDYLEFVHSLAYEFAKTAIERDRLGGTAKVDGLIAHLFGYHFFIVTLVHL